MLEISRCTLACSASMSSEVWNELTTCSVSLIQPRAVAQDQATEREAPRGCFRSHMSKPKPRGMPKGVPSQALQSRRVADVGRVTSPNHFRSRASS
eukprot:3785551-Pleurochrysis_carterae.AAC.1